MTERVEGFKGPTYTQESPQPRMRYLLRDDKPVLQQAWSIVEYVDGDPVKAKAEWRDVPTVDA